jgi:hypothetical protein
VLSTIAHASWATRQPAPDPWGMEPRLWVKGEAEKAHDRFIHAEGICQNRFHASPGAVAISRAVLADNCLDATSVLPFDSVGQGTDIVPIPHNRLVVGTGERSGDPESNRSNRPARSRTRGPSNGSWQTQLSNSFRIACR